MRELKVYKIVKHKNRTCHCFCTVCKSTHERVSPLDSSSLLVMCALSRDSSSRVMVCEAFLSCTLRDSISVFVSDLHEL